MYREAQSTKYLQDRTSSIAAIFILRINSKGRTIFLHREAYGGAGEAYASIE